MWQELGHSGMEPSILLQKHWQTILSYGSKHEMLILRKEPMTKFSRKNPKPKAEGTSVHQKTVLMNDSINKNISVDTRITPQGRVPDRNHREKGMGNSRGNFETAPGGVAAETRLSASRARKTEALYLKFSLPRGLAERLASSSYR